MEYITCLLIAMLLSALSCLFMWMHRQEQKRRQVCRRVDTALAEQRAAHREELYAALAAQRAAFQLKMDVMKEEVFSEALAYLRNERNLEAGMREMQHGLRAPDESVLRPDHPKALVAAPRSRRTADAADGPELSTDFRSSCTSQPGPRAAPRPSAGSSHDRHVRVDPMPTPVSGISRGGAARTRREARGSQSTASVLPQSFPTETAGARGSRLFLRASPRRRSASTPEA